MKPRVTKADYVVIAIATVVVVSGGPAWVCVAVAGWMLGKGLALLH